MSVFRETSAAVSACICMFVTGCWLAWPSPALRKLEVQGGANVFIEGDEISWVVASLDVGNMVSPIPASYLVDRIGRKPVLLATGPLYLICWMLTFVPGTPYFLFLSRFLSGIGKGIAFSICPMYLGEIASVEVRGAISTISTGALWGGSLLMFIVGPLVSYQWLNTIGAIFPIIFFMTFLWIPESPYGCLMRNKVEEARKSLQWLREGADQLTIEKELEQMKENVEEEMKTKGTFVDLVAIPSNRKATTIVMVSSAFQRLCGISAVLAFSSTTLPNVGFQFFHVSQVIVVFGIVLTIGNFLATPLVDHLGRKPLLFASSIGLAISTATSGFYYLLRKDPEQAAWLPYMALVCFGIFHSIGLGVIPSTLLSELFPANVKSRAAAVSSIVFAAASFVTNKMYHPVQHSIGTHAMFFFFSMNAVIFTIFNALFIFETKGKSFPDIQKRLKSLK
uniref:Sugar transporter 14 n=1 Tax=Nilaparvata lugens TaxID=108931 RepID=D4AHX9_NILLU|nr:sugar transporter 14 [Nilaparvata lugens]